MLSISRSWDLLIKRKLKNREGWGTKPVKESQSTTCRKYLIGVAFYFRMVVIKLHKPFMTINEPNF